MNASLPEGVALTHGEDGRLHLSGRVGLATVSALMEVGSAALESAAPAPVVSLKEVQAEGSAILALLIGWQRACLGRGHTVSFVDVPLALQQVAEASEVAEVLGISPTA